MNSPPLFGHRPKTAITSIAEFNEIERTIKGKPAEEHFAARQKGAKMIFHALEGWLIVTKLTLAAGQPVAKAMGYAINHMKHRRRYLDDGRLAVDNYAAERAVRLIALGRKNFLFFGSGHAGERAAVIFILIKTAKLNRINPQAWLTHVIATIGEYKETDLDHLLPRNVAEKRRAQTFTVERWRKHYNTTRPYTNIARVKPKTDSERSPEKMVSSGGSRV